MPAFDAIADRYEDFRRLPEGVPAAVREAVQKALGNVPIQWLDVGAGTGRIGEAFVRAGDRYVASDPSRLMLDQFTAKLTAPGARPFSFVQADGRFLPFDDGCFDAVLLVSVLSSVPGWRRLLDESRRVLRPGGSLVLGQTVRPPDGVDAKMKAQLAEILGALGVEPRAAGAARDEARDRLARDSTRRARVSAAQWISARSPSEFLARHRTGARFAALPQHIQDEALGRLRDWAADQFDTLDAIAEELHSFEIDVFAF
jgi:ubiquinone/menaquinone biosynthesis C-methylase UbiE